MTKFVQKLPRRAAWLFVVAGVLLLAAWIVQGSNSFQSCLQGDTERFDDAVFRTIADTQTASPGDIECLGDFLDANEPTIVALAAVVIAGFTGTLWAATKRVQRSNEQLARTADETAQRQLRAYVSGAPEAVFSFDEGHAPRVRLILRNGGATPANEVRHRAIIAALPHAAAADLRQALAGESFSPPCVLFPHAEARVIAQRQTPLDQTTIAALRDETARLYCYGEIDYVDTFMHPHTTRFCHEICADAETLQRLTSLYGPDDLKIEFQIASFGNTAS